MLGFVFAGAFAFEMYVAAESTYDLGESHR